MENKKNTEKTNRFPLQLALIIFIVSAIFTIIAINLFNTEDFNPLLHQCIDFDVVDCRFREGGSIDSNFMNNGRCDYFHEGHTGSHASRVKCSKWVAIEDQEWLHRDFPSCFENNTRCWDD